MALSCRTLTTTPGNRVHRKCQHVKQTCAVAPGAMTEGPWDVKDCMGMCGQGPLARNGGAMLTDKNGKYGCYDHLPGLTETPKRIPGYDYPTHYPTFDWWTGGAQRRREMYMAQKAKCIEERCPKSLDIPVPSVPDRYPYRYTSAGPTSFGRTQREWDCRRAWMKCCPKSGNKKKDGNLRLREVFEAGGYETTTLKESLKPFQLFQAKDVKTPNLPLGKGLLEPTFIPWMATSEFDRYIIDTLHPGWMKDPLYKRRVIFNYYPKDPKTGQ